MTKLADEAKISLVASNLVEEGKTVAEAGTGQNPEAAVKASPGETVCIWKQKAKLYRYRDDQWKERGTGNARFMRDNGTKRVSLMMRQDKTMKPIINIMLDAQSVFDLAPHSEKPEQRFVFNAMDQTEEIVNDKFVICF